MTRSSQRQSRGPCCPNPLKVLNVWVLAAILVMKQMREPWVLPCLPALHLDQTAAGNQTRAMSA